jgi:hypothetical protein
MSESDSTPEVMRLLASTRARVQSAEARELLSMALDAILFITSTGQRFAFEDFRKHLGAQELPPVVAAFDTRAEADSWLSSHPEPPDSTFVLVGDSYHIVFYRRETNLRRMIPDPVLEYHLGGLLRAGLPPAVASFSTREEAVAWLEAQAEPAQQAVLLIGGQPHLAVYHRNVNRRALYSFSPAAG